MNMATAVGTSYMNNNNNNNHTCQQQRGAKTSNEENHAQCSPWQRIKHVDLIRTEDGDCCWTLAVDPPKVFPTPREDIPPPSLPSLLSHP